MNPSQKTENFLSAKDFKIDVSVFHWPSEKIQNQNPHILKETETNIFFDPQKWIILHFWLNQGISSTDVTFSQQSFMS